MDKVFYAPVLPCEGWTSIDRYRQDYEHMMPKMYPDLCKESLLPNEEVQISGWKRRYFRDIAYPLKIARARKMRGSANSPLHVFDHSYAHLLSKWDKTILHCRDLNHLVMPSLTGFALLRWKQRLMGMRNSSAVIAISNQLSEEIQEHVGIPKDRIKVIHHGVDLECYRPDRGDEAREVFPELAKLTGSHFLILNVGTNLPRKNLKTLYQAVKLMADKNIPVKLIRVGTNASAEGEEERIREFGVEDNVIQMGILNSEEVALVCNLCHAMSFASLYEGFGRPLLESQACGLPLIAANNSCLPEIAGKGAMYHEPLSAENLSELLEKVIGGDGSVALSVQEGFENTKRFHWSSHLDQLVELYRQV
jgi:glycosyltransferase involved in cell wall biosynthesis